MKIASATKGHLEKEFEGIINKVDKLYSYIKEDAKELTELIHGMNCHVNLIPVNPIRERDYVQSNAHVIEAFKEKLERSGLTVTVRREMGRDIDGACGQLRRKYKENQRLA
mgnify:CR=1 FL=1